MAEIAPQDVRDQLIGPDLRRVFVRLCNLLVDQLEKHNGRVERNEIEGDFLDIEDVSLAASDPAMNAAIYELMAAGLVTITKAGIEERVHLTADGVRLHDLMAGAVFEDPSVPTTAPPDPRLDDPSWGSWG